MGTLQCAHTSDLTCLRATHRQAQRLLKIAISGWTLVIEKLPENLYTVKRFPLTV